MKAIQIASIGGPEVLESDYVRPREQLPPIMDAVFGMYFAKDLEVLIRPAYASRTPQKPTEISRVESPLESLCLLSGDEHGAKESQDEDSKRTSEIQNGPTRNGTASLQP
jgi:hypothetical protein